MKFWIRRIHIYLGLLNFTILAIFGLAGLVVTAEAPDIMHGGSVPVTTSVPFQPPGAASDKDVGALIGQALQPRHAGRPTVRRNEQRQLVADFYSVNGLVRATLLEKENRLNVETRRNSIFRFIDNAHATSISQTTSSWAVNAWAWYIEISIWSLLLMAMSGLWLGLTTRWPYWWTKASLAAGTAMFLLFYWVEK